MIARGPISLRRGLASSRSGRGQTLVEFALVLPVFMLMLFAILDGGRMIYENSVASQAAREGARLAAVEASWIGSADRACGTANGPVCPGSATTGTSGSPSLKSDVLAAANRMTSPFGRISDGRLYMSCDAPGSAPTGGWTGVSCTGHSIGNLVSVRVQLEYTPITPILAQLIGPVWLSGSASMVIN